MSTVAACAIGDTIPHTVPIAKGPPSIATHTPIADPASR